MSKFRDIVEPLKRVFVVGDIHGCRREVSILLDYLLSELSFSNDDGLVFIGDYIDRGADSKGVIDLLLSLKKEFSNVVFLRGNHEDMLLDFLGFEGSMGEVYLHNGGRETLASYGIKIDASHSDIIQALPKDHLSFFLDLESYVGIGNYVFAHAGLDPGRDLSAQMDSDIFWIRDAFIANVHNFDRTIVFGHTPYQDVMFDNPYKIGIDTGCVYGNRLSCLELTGKTILQVDFGDKKVKTKPFP